jgi:hypothetical protein
MTGYFFSENVLREYNAILTSWRVYSIAVEGLWAIHRAMGISRPTRRRRKPRARCTCSYG